MGAVNVSEGAIEISLNNSERRGAKGRGIKLCLKNSNISPG
jgi:hypothetical protein